MYSLPEAMMNVITNCELKLDKQIISKELLMQTFADFLSQTIAKRKHNVGVVLHTGSVCFDVLAVTYSALANLITNRADVMDIIESLTVGDIVLYGKTKKERCVFEGFVDGAMFGPQYAGTKYILLTQGKGASNYIAEKSWRFIEPYNGNSKRLDGRGLRKKNTIRDDFFEEILGYEKENIPSVIDTSSVIVTSREEADRLIKGISIGFNGKEIQLLELVIASYFTDEDEYRYGGNTGKNEPIIKFTSKVSVARTLLLSKKGNTHLGLMILGNEILQRAASEIPELLNRKSLQYVYVCSSLDSISDISFVDDYEELEVFACTKDFLLEHTTPEVNSDNALTRELEQQANIVIDKKCEMMITDEQIITKDDYKSFRNNLLKVKRMEFESSDKDNFIVHAHSLMNMFITAPFSMERFCMAKDRGLIEVDEPGTKISNLVRWAESFLGGANLYAREIIESIQRVYERVKSDTPKQKWLREFLYTHAGKKVVVIVPKAYYITVLKDTGMFPYYATQRVTFATPGRFDNSNKYDYVVVLGDYNGKNFNAFRCNAAKNIISALYECETRGYRFKQKSVKNDYAKYQKKSTILLDFDDEEDFAITEDENEAIALSNEIEDFISSVALYSPISYSGYKGSNGSGAIIPTEIVAIASFDDETRAYFSKHYRGYVLDESSGTVKEEGALSFCEGDSIVFTQNNEETKDIVSAVLSQLILDGKLDENSTEKCRIANMWKDGLIEFMNANGYSARTVAQLMIADGATVQEPTILRWLDEDAHTVGPRSMESISHIGNITGIEIMKTQPEIVFEACREVRSIRRKILDQIGNAIVDKLSGKAPKPGTEFIYDRVDSLATIMQIENIVFTETTVPMNIANRPITVQ